MLLIIDGYNLIFSYQHLPDTPKNLEKARENLLRVLTQYNTRRKYQIIVVFDGREIIPHKQTIQNASAGIEIIFSEQNITADEVIANLVSRSRHPKNITVITNDRPLTSQVKNCGAGIIKSSDFAEEIKPHYPAESKTTEAAEPPEKISGVTDKYQVEAWLKLFEGKK